MGETAGGPAGHGRDAEDEDEAGNSNWVEQLADRANDYHETGRHDSQKTLTENSEDDEGEQIPNYWFSIRRRMREPLAEYLISLADPELWLIRQQMARHDGICSYRCVRQSAGENFGRKGR